MAYESRYTPRNYDARSMDDDFKNDIEYFLINRKLTEKLRNELWRRVFEHNKLKILMRNNVTAFTVFKNTIKNAAEELLPLLLPVVIAGIGTAVVRGIANPVKVNMVVSKQNLKGDAPIHSELTPLEMPVRKDNLLAKPTMGLTKFLDDGGSVMGSPYDKLIMPLGSMSDSAKKRYGYLDADGYWTERGYDRATSADYKNLDLSSKAFMKIKE